MPVKDENHMTPCHEALQVLKFMGSGGGEAQAGRGWEFAFRGDSFCF